MPNYSNTQLKQTSIFSTVTSKNSVTAFDIIKSYLTNQKGAIPTQTSNANKALVTDGTNTSWAFPGVLNTWNTAGRPAAPVPGQYGFNTQTNAFEIWNTTWRTVATV